MFHLPFVLPRIHAAGFFHIEGSAVVPVIGGDDNPPAPRIDRHVIEQGIVELDQKAGFADPGCRIIGFVGEYFVGVNARVAALERIPYFQITGGSAAGTASLRPPFVQAFDRNFGPPSGIGFRVDSCSCYRVFAARSVGPVAPGASCFIQHLQTLILERKQSPRAFIDLRRYQPIGEGIRRRVFGQGNVWCREFSGIGMARYNLPQKQKKALLQTRQ